MSKVSDALNTLANYLWSVSPGCGERAQQPVRLVAHRGAHGVISGSTLIENTLAGFDWCLVHGAWGIEFDVHLTRDGEPVVHHDAHCGRVFGRSDIAIAGTDFSVLRKAVPDIPHLSEVVERYGGKLHLMIEIKTSWRDSPELPVIVTRSLSSLEPCRDFHLLSLVPDHLEGFSELPRESLVDVAQTNTAHIVKQNLELGHGAVAGSFALMSNACLRKLREAGRQTGTGMVENQRILNREAWRGVDWIFTDRIQDFLPLKNA
jgi:glycerophosphoryl diester phosphodiesterase